MLVLACFMLPGVGFMKPRRDMMYDLGVPLAVGLLTMVACRWVSSHDLGVKALQAAVAIPALIAFGQRRRPVRFGLSVGALVLAGLIFGRPPSRSLLRGANVLRGVPRQRRSDRPVSRAGPWHDPAWDAGHDGPESASHSPISIAEGPFGQAFNALPQAMTGKEHRRDRAGSRHTGRVRTAWPGLDVLRDRSRPSNESRETAATSIISIAAATAAAS